MHLLVRLSLAAVVTASTAGTSLLAQQQTPPARKAAATTGTAAIAGVVIDRHYDPLGKLVRLMRGKTSASGTSQRGNGGGRGGET